MNDILLSFLLFPLEALVWSLILLPIGMWNMMREEKKKSSSTTSNSGAINYKKG